MSTNQIRLNQQHLPNSSSSSFSSSDFSSSSSSFSSSSSSLTSSSHMSTRTNDDDDDIMISENEDIIKEEGRSNKKEKKEEKTKSAKKVIVFCMINLLFLFFNFIFFFIFINYLYSFNTSPQQQQQQFDNEQKNKYQLIIENTDIDEHTMIINKIVEYDHLDFEFVENFYGFEDDKGNNGILVKIDLEENIDEWKICSNDCKCIVECREKNDCNDGNEECVENKCVNYINRGMGMMRGETMMDDEEKERKEVGMAGVSIVVPMMVCVFGAFSTMFLAKEYGQKYFSEKCEKVCPTDSISSSIEGEVDAERTDEWKKQSSFYCNGECKYNVENMYKMIDSYEQDLTGIQVNQIVEAEGMCSDITIKNVFMVEEDVFIAKEKFYPIGNLKCMEEISRIVRGEVYTTVGKVMKEACGMDKRSVECRRF